VNIFFLVKSLAYEVEFLACLFVLACDDPFFARCFYDWVKVSFLTKVIFLEPYSHHLYTVHLANLDTDMPMKAAEKL